MKDCEQSLQRLILIESAMVLDEQLLQVLELRPAGLQNIGLRTLDVQLQVVDR